MELLEGMMTDPNDAEIAAMKHASRYGGEYIESLGKTDMAAWSETEWMEFVEAVCTGYVDSLLKQQVHTRTALDKIQGAPFEMA